MSNEPKKEKKEASRYKDTVNLPRTDFPMKADLVLFDEKEIGDRATFESPHQYAVGVKFVLVSGEVIFDGKAMTTARPGKILKGPSSNW